MIVTQVLGLTTWQSMRYVSDGIVAAERYANMGATCPSCGSTNTRRVEVYKDGKLVRTYFACNDCGNVW